MEHRCGVEGVEGGEGGETSLIYERNIYIYSVNMRE